MAAETPVAPVRGGIRGEGPSRRRFALRPRRLVKGAVVTVGVAAFLVFALFPFYWMFIVSLKSNQDIINLKDNPFLIQQFTLSHYEFLLTQTDFLRWILNSTIVAVVACGGSVIISIFAGYSLARVRYRGAGAIGWGIFVTYLVPPTLLFIPMTVIMDQFHLVDNLLALMLSYPTFLIPFSTWLLMGYFRGIPKELEDAAMVDGCTRFQAMLRIAIPLAVPGIISASIFAFTLSWNEYLYALSFISSVGTQTVPLGVPSDLIRDDAYFWGDLMAAALLGSVPVAILYSFFVDRFAGGLTAGAVKG